MDDLFKVCAVVDIQGFEIGDKFYPRELAIVRQGVDGFNEECNEIYCNFDENFIKTKQNKLWLDFQETLIHGIPYTNVLEYGYAFHENEIKNHLSSIYNLYETKNHFHFAIKNKNLEKILDEIRIPYLNLKGLKIENEFVPSLHKFDKINPHLSYCCPLHTKIFEGNNIPTKYRCSLRKCRHIGNWIHKKTMRHIFKSIKPITSSLM